MRILILYCFVMLVGLPSALSRGIFAMHPVAAEAYMPLVRNILSGNIDPGTTKRVPKEYQSNSPGYNEEGMIFPYAVDSNGMVYPNISTAPKNVIAVIPINGPIMKYDYCNAFGTVTYSHFLRAAERLDNVVGILLDVDTGGGEGYGSKAFGDLVDNCSKPVITWINDGHCASAGVMMTCNSDRILVSQNTSKYGSVGVYTMIGDPKGVYEKEGWKIITVYSPKSPEKNKDWREAMDNGNVGLLEKDLEFFDNQFMQQVRNGRGNKLNEKALLGGHFYADEAIEMGLVDDYATFEQAIEQLFNLSGSSQTFV